MRKIKDVLRLKLDAQLSHERIAASLGISKGVVTKFLATGGVAPRQAQGCAQAARLGYVVGGKKQVAVGHLRQATGVALWKMTR